MKPTPAPADANSCRCVEKSQQSMQMGDCCKRRSLHNVIQLCLEKFYPKPFHTPSPIARSGIRTAGLTMTEVSPYAYALLSWVHGKHCLKTNIEIMDMFARSIHGWKMDNQWPLATKTQHLARQDYCHQLGWPSGIVGMQPMSRIDTHPGLPCAHFREEKTWKSCLVNVYNQRSILLLWSWYVDFAGFHVPATAQIASVDGQDIRSDSSISDGLT